MFILKIQYIKNLDRLSNMIVEIIVFMFNIPLTRILVMLF